MPSQEEGIPEMFGRTCPDSGGSKQEADRRAEGTERILHPTQEGLS